MLVRLRANSRLAQRANSYCQPSLALNAGYKKE